MNNTVKQINQIIELVNQKKLNPSLRYLAHLDSVTLIQMEEGKYYGNCDDGVIFWAYKNEIPVLKNILHKITIL